MTKRVRGDEVRKDQLLDWLRQREEEMAALVAELVAIPTENPPAKNYRACADLLENRLGRFGLECERLEASELKGSAGESPVSVVASYGRGNAFSIFTGITMSFRRSRRNSFSLCAKSISCLAADRAT